MSFSYPHKNSKVPKIKNRFETGKILLLPLQSSLGKIIDIRGKKIIYSLIKTEPIIHLSELKSNERVIIFKKKKVITSYSQSKKRDVNPRNSSDS